MDVEAIRAALAPDGGERERAVLDAFLSGLDRLYFSREGPESVAAHVRMAAALGPSCPARVSVAPRDDGRYDVAVVAFDYFAILSVLCGLLAVHRLGIESGHAHTLALPAPPDVRTVPMRWRGRPGVVRRMAPPTSRRVIVDVFRVRPWTMDAPDAAALEKDLLELFAAFTDGRPEVARERLGARLVEALAASWEAGTAPGRAALAPLEIAFHDEGPAAETVMDVRGPDTPGFLYALANALAMRGVEIRQVRIESVDGEARDRLWVARRDGQAALDEEDRRALRVAVALLKQFTHLLPWAPDPVRALRYFDQFLDRAMAAGSAGETLARPESLRELARLLGSSQFLWEEFLRVQFEHLAPILEGWRERELPAEAAVRNELRVRLAASTSPEGRDRALNAVKDEQVFLIEMKRLLDPAVTLERFSEALSEVADTVLEAALGLCLERLDAQHGRPRDASGREVPVALFGLGKLGGRELGFASDLELLVAYGGPGHAPVTGIDGGVFFDALVRALIAVIAAREDGTFHLDLRLRPFGSGGPLSTPLDALRDYYRPDGAAAPFERQALVKLRALAGDAELARAVLAQRDAFVWSERPWDREDALHLRERQARELVPAGRFSVKYSRGALVDVEYTAQYLQVQHGRAHAEVRTTSTRDALDRLQRAGLLSADEHQTLTAAYAFWRGLVDALRMVHGHARDLLVPAEGSEELLALARRLGYPGRSAAEALLADVRDHRDRVRALFLSRFGG